MGAVLYQPIQAPPDPYPLQGSLVEFIQHSLQMNFYPFLEKAGYHRYKDPHPIRFKKEFIATGYHASKGQ
jgi:hypothetical protein